MLNPRLGLPFVMTTNSLPLRPLGLGRQIRIAIRNLHTHQQRQPAVDRELVELVEQRETRMVTRSVFLIELDDVFGAGKVGVGAAGAPERRVEPRVELVVDREEAADVVPDAWPWRG